MKTIRMLGAAVALTLVPAAAFAAADCCAGQACCKQGANCCKQARRDCCDDAAATHGGHATAHHAE